MCGIDPDPLFQERRKHNPNFDGNIKLKALPRDLSLQGNSTVHTVKQRDNSSTHTSVSTLFLSHKLLKRAKERRNQRTFLCRRMPQLSNATAMVPEFC